MQKQFWNEEKTNKSFETLNQLAGSAGFVLIGGWAAYFYAGTQKSQDIDIAIGYDSLNFFKKYGLNEYAGTKIKYSIINDTYVDLFIEQYSDKDLPVPVSRILKDYALIENMKVVNRELLLLLKLWGYFRSDEVKLRKDIVDVVSLLFYSGIDISKFKGYVDEYRIEKRKSADILLEYLDKAEYFFEFICDTKNEYTKLKERYKEQVKRVFNY